MANSLQAYLSSQGPAGVSAHCLMALCRDQLEQMRVGMEAGEVEEC